MKFANNSQDFSQLFAVFVVVVVGIGSAEGGHWSRKAVGNLCAFSCCLNPIGMLLSRANVATRHAQTSARLWPLPAAPLPPPSPAPAPGASQTNGLLHTQQ